MKKYSIFALSTAAFVLLGAALIMNGPKEPVDSVHAALGSPSSTPGDFTTGLVGWWKFDEGTGTTVTDSSGYNANGAFQCSATNPNWITGHDGTGYALDFVQAGGSYCRVNLGSPSQFNITGPMTVSSWVKFTDSGNQIYVAKWGNTASYVLYATGGNLGFTISDGVNPQHANTTKLYNDGKWHMVTGVYDGTHVLIYVDGNADIVTGSSYSGAVNSTSEYLSIGDYSVNGSAVSLKQMDDVRLYSRGLSSTDVAALYSYSSGYAYTGGNGLGAAYLTGNLSGWAWSSNIGWVSFNSKDYGTPDCQSYCVTVDNSSGSMSGYAWSSNIGWIRFGNPRGVTMVMQNIPNGGQLPYVSSTTGQVTGWARACAGTIKSGDSQTNPVSPGDCSTMTKRLDGWDGWIELSGPKHTSPNSSGYQGTSTQGVTMNSRGAFSGFAWGGDVVGWLNFNAAASTGYSPVTCPNCVTTANYLSATCSIPSGSANMPASSANRNVTATAAASGGSGTYTYAWSMGSGYTAPSAATTNTTATYNFFIPNNTSPNPKVYTLYAQVTDSNNATKIAQCGTVTVAGAASATNVSLWVNKASTPTQVFYQAKPGGSAPLFWQSAGMQSCSSYVISSPGNAAPSGWTNGAALASTNNSSAPFNITMPVVAGTYKLAIQCQSNTKDSTGNFPYIPTNYSDTTYNGQPIQTQVTISVSSSTLIEF